MKTITLAPKWSTRKLRFTIRGEGSDTDVLKEVIERRCYRKPSIGFTTEPGETWLDLGANIGAFAAYCYLCGAVAECYEPEPSCFELLRKNINLDNFYLHNEAVTTSRHHQLRSVRSNNPENNYRLTFLTDKAPDRYVPAGEMQNLHVGKLFNQKTERRTYPAKWDGAKLDIEGSELAMIDEGFIPDVHKLVMEYHFSRDDGSMANFHRRMKILRKHFDVVSYAPSLDHQKTGKYPGRFDINVFCINK